MTFKENIYDKSLKRKIRDKAKFLLQAKMDVFVFKEQ